jgi:UDP-glucuronate 4-epimerase
VDGIESALTYDCSGFDIINLGRSEPVVLLDMINTIEKHLKKQAKLDFKDAQIGDVPYTYANIDKARKLLGYNPTTSFDDGIRAFTDWFLKQPLRLKAIVQEK